LAAWAEKHLVNRRDAWGAYYRKDGAAHQTTRKAQDEIGPKGARRTRGPLTEAVLVNHFKREATEARVGLHSTYRDEAGECWSRWGAVDIDAHPGQPCDPAANVRYALALYAAAGALGFRPLLFDSNGRGGYHLLLVFAAPVPTRTVFSFLQWLIRDWGSHGFTRPPETFPKQPGIAEGKYGNWLRLPGRHHTRAHHTRVWDGGRWLEAAEAIRFIVQTKGAEGSLIPAEARPDLVAPSDLGRAVGRAQSDGDATPHRPKRERADGAVYPGDDFNDRASWREILEPHGWVLDHESEGVGFWRRPGKGSGHGATTNHNGNHTFYVFTCNASPFVQHGSYSKFGAYAVLNHAGDFTAAARALSRDGYGTRDDGRETQAQALLRLASDADLARTDDGRAYARVPVGTHHENHEVRSGGFKRWLTRAFYREFDRPPTSDALQGALGVLEARAQFDGVTEPVHVRVAPGDGGSVLIDLGDDSWRAVRVGPGGWEVIDRPPVRFRRPAGLRPLPTPERGGTVHDLRRFVNVSEADFLLFIAWITAALLSQGPFPVLPLAGEQGSAKSTTARVIRRLTDPHVCMLRSEPKAAHDLFIAATNGWVLAFDNVSFVPLWLSDNLCRLATGGGFATRQLYTDSEEVFLDAQRPVILTGIEEYVGRADLADRCVFLHLPTIAEPGRRTEAEFWAEFEAAHARLFGALLDALAGGLRLRPEVTLPRLPRMADFAVWGEAVCRSLGWPEGEFLAAYQTNRQSAHEAALEDSPVAPAVRALMAGRGAWEGTATELLQELNGRRPESAKPPDRWPKGGRGLSGQLRRLAPALRAAGLDVAFKVDRDRRLRLTAVDGGAEPAQRAQPSRTPEKPSHPRDGRAHVATVGPDDRSAPDGLPGASCDGCARCDGRPPVLTADGREVFEL
jgi:hypothetical protein